MWRTPWPWFTAVLAVALVVTARRLSDTQVELERVRSQADEGHFHTATAVNPRNGIHARPDREALDMSAEWEQAVPPMDS